MIQFTGDEWKSIEAVASERLKHNITSRHVSVYGTGIEVMGAAGELAVRRFFGVPEKLGTHFDGGTDLIYNGYRLDVKATIWTKRVQFRFMQWPIWKPIKADVITLVAIDDKFYRALILGYATRTEISTAHINSTRYDPCHEIPIQNLHPMRELMPPAPKPEKRLDDASFHDLIIGRDGVCLYGLAHKENCSGGLDAHHIKTKGSGGRGTLENGITLCRSHHQLAGDYKIKPEELRRILTMYYGYTYDE
jgi:hypothetical protein